MHSKRKSLSLLVTAVFCTFLWGSAPPVIKMGYAAMHIEQTGSIILFAGIRFFLAGCLVIAFASFQNHTFEGFEKRDLWPIVVLAFFQTFGQYFFYYLGCARASGMMVSALSGTSALLALLFSAWIFHLEKMTVLKLLGCLLGLAGILVMNMQGMQFQFSWSAEGIVLASQIFSALSAVLIKIYSRDRSPVRLSGWQFVIGGAGLIVAGVCMHGHIAWNLAGMAIVLWLAFVSAGAYTLWGILLSRYPVSSVGIFSCLIPVFGVVLSWILLQESCSWSLLAALILICAGILCINRSEKGFSRKRMSEFSTIEEEAKESKTQ